MKLKIVFKNITIIYIEMDLQISETEFENIYAKVFRPYTNGQNNDKLRQKKFRLKKKLCKGCITKPDDYELILFNYISKNMT